jgi:hypothetical protein
MVVKKKSKQSSTCQACSNRHGVWPEGNTYTVGQRGDEVATKTGLAARSTIQKAKENRATQVGSSAATESQGVQQSARGLA